MYINSDFVRKVYLIGILFCFSIDLGSPFIVYGTQILLIIIFAFFTLLQNVRFKLNNLLCLIVISLILCIYTYIQTFTVKHNELIWFQLIKVLLWCSSCYIIYPYLKLIKRDTYLIVFRLVIFVFSISLFVQLLGYYLLNTVIDYSLLLGGEKSRILFGTLFRPSGLTSEPSVFAGVMTGFIVLYYLLNKKIDKFIIIGLISNILTSSVMGLILSLCYIFIIFFVNLKLRMIFSGVVLLGIAVFLTYPYINYRYDSVMNNNDSSNQVKIESISNFSENNNLFYFGYGLIGKSKSAPVYYEGLYDLTFPGAMIITFGLPFGSILICFFIFFIYKLNFSFKEKLLILIPFIKLSALISAFIYCYIIMVIVVSYKNKKIVN